MTEPHGPIDWANQQATEREQQPTRYTADTITSDALDQLYARAERAERVAKSAARDTTMALADYIAAEQRAEEAERTIARMKSTNRMVNGAARDARLRAVQTEAANARVRALADEWARVGRDPNTCIDMSDAADALHAALDEPKGPRPPAKHVGNSVNAEDCPGCSGTNPPWPFICPGP